MRFRDTNFDMDETEDEEVVEPHHEESQSQSQPTSCCHSTLKLTVEIIHLAQFITGIGLLVYAIALSLHKPDPQHAIAILLEFYTILLLLSSIMGSIGLVRPGWKRIFLKISTILAPVLAAINCFLAFLLMAERTSFFRYIQDKKEQLYISDSMLSYLKNDLNVHVLYYILFSMAMVELIRYYLLQRLKDNLDSHHEEERGEFLRHRARRIGAARRRWRTNPYNDRNRNNNNRGDDEDNDDDNGMTDPLLSNHVPPASIFTSRRGRAKTSSSQHGRKSRDQSQSNMDKSAEDSTNIPTLSSWWVEPEQTQNRKSDGADADSESSGWLSGVFKGNSKSSKKKAERKETDDSFDGDGDDDSSDMFAPVDEDIEAATGTITPWEGNGGEEVCNERESGPDISWAQEEESSISSNGNEPNTSWANG